MAYLCRKASKKRKVRIPTKSPSKTEETNSATFIIFASLKCLVVAWYPILVVCKA